MVLMSLVALPATAQEKKPNILVIWGDDIGWFNISAYNMGKMGYRTPNIDRIAREGVLFTDFNPLQGAIPRSLLRDSSEPGSF